MKFVLSPKYKEFMKYQDAEWEVLEGTTASGKTTTGIVKFIFKVMENQNYQHIISGQNLGIIEKNIITSDLGILDMFGDIVEYNPHGRGDNNLSHIILHAPKGDKVIYILGYDNTSRWKSALGGQYGCVYIDEINTAEMSYIRQVAMRCDYLMATLNPDDPDKEVYQEFINRCRPLPQYVDSTPKQLLDELTADPMPRWVWWYFTFDDNYGLTEEKKAKIKSTHLPGTADYRHYIMGLRGKAEGVIFDNFDEKKHCISFRDSLKLIKDNQNKNETEWFVIFTAGLDTSYSKNSDDTVAMSFLGITNKKNVYVLDECVLNNKEARVPFAPSDVAEKFQKFLEKNRNVYGFAKDTFIDNADQASITELAKFKSKTGSIYNFNPAHKALKIIDRIQLQKGWFATGNMYIVNTCHTYIKELKTYSWCDSKAKIEPEDGNDHMINSVQYAWMPFKLKIG